MGIQKKEWRSFLAGDFKNSLMEEIAFSGILQSKYNSFFIINWVKHYLFCSSREDWLDKQLHTPKIRLMLKISNSTVCTLTIQNRCLTFQNGQMPAYVLYWNILAEYEPYLSWHK